MENTSGLNSALRDADTYDYSPENYYGGPLGTIQKSYKWEEKFSFTRGDCCCGQ